MNHSSGTSSVHRGTGRRGLVLRWSIGGFVLGVVGALLAAGVLTVVLAWPHRSVVRTDRQPPTVSYAPYGHVDELPHYVVLKKRYSWGGRLLGRSRHELWLGRDPAGNHGHLVELRITGTRPDRFAVTWTAHGVSVTFEEGHRLDVPASAFTGGR